MEDFDDDLTIIQLRDEMLDGLNDPPALPFPLVRRKRRLDLGIIYELTARLWAS